MKIFLFLSLTFFSLSSFAKNPAPVADTSKLTVPEISYESLDSLIKTNEYTAIFFWPTWCSHCFTYIPELVNVLKDKKSIQFILINEATSAHNVKKRLITFPDAVKGIWRMEEIYYAPTIAINYFKEMKYFNQHFIHQKKESENKRNPAFFLLDRKGKLLWFNKDSFILEDVKEALKDYR